MTSLPTTGCSMFCCGYRESLVGTEVEDERSHCQVKSSQVAFNKNK